jgi:hypothetical protein
MLHPIRQRTQRGAVGHQSGGTRPTDYDLRSMSAARPVIRFWPHLFQTHIASTRIRCLQVIDGLLEQGVDAALYEPSEPAPRILVLAKRYDEATLQQARSLQEAHGTRLILDLCDNHFHHQPGDESWASRADRLRHACVQSDLVVTASETLANVVSNEVHGCHVKVVPDSLDRYFKVSTKAPSAINRFHAWRWDWFARRHPVTSGRRLMWFGNHGSSNAEGGMTDLRRITIALARHHQHSPITLCVVSNRWRTWRRLSRDWAWPSLYLPWSDDNFNMALSQNDVALIPAQFNPFTVCKTNNRLATAFIKGLAVAADPLPSYEEFRDLAVLGNWDEGLAELMDRQDLRQQRIQTARQLLEQRYSLSVISRRWIKVLAESSIGLD